MRCFKILTLFCFLMLDIYAQNKKSTAFINLGYDRVGSTNFVKAGYKLAFTPFYEFESNFNTLTVDISLSPFDSKMYFKPSLTYNFYGLFYFFDLNSCYIIGDNKADLRIAPQIGLTYFNVLNIGYSYFIPINSSNEIVTIGKSSLNFTINIPLKIIAKK